MRPINRSLFFASGIALAGSMLLAACGTDTATSSSTAAAADASATTASTVSYAEISSLGELAYEDLGIADFDVETSGARSIVLADGASKAADGATVSGDTVTITEGGVYRLSGTLSAGQVVIDAGEEDVTLVLDGVDITAANVGAIVVASADDVQVYLAEGSTNIIADAAGATVAEDAEVNATLFSSADLWLGGPGSLTVTSAANDGIASKDSLVIDGGTISVTATDDGIRGKDHLVVLSGDLTVTAGDDGLVSDNEDGGTDATLAVGVVWIADGSVLVDAGDDGIVGYRQVTMLDGTVQVAAADDGVHTEGVMRLAGGSVTVTESTEGIEAAIMFLSGAAIDVTAADDGVNVAGGPGVESSGDAGMGGQAAGGQGGQAAGGQPGGGMESGADSGRYLEISGGSLVVDAQGDGIDVGGAYSQTGGTVVVSGPTNDGNGALDVDGTFTISGGSLIAAGSAGMAMAPTGDGQGVLGMSLGSDAAAGTRVTVKDESGMVIASFVTPKAAATLVVSTPDLASGGTYTVTTEGESSGGETTGSATFGGTVSGDEELGSLTAS